MAEDLHLASGTESDTSEGTSGRSSPVEEEEVTWVQWFARLKGNEFFCEVEESYINDDFNLSGLGALVPYYDYALDFIREAESLEVLTEAQQEVVENAAEVLYGLIHARYIITARGLAAMAEKFRNAEFGRCPRMLCHGQPCLPVGLSDLPRQATVKLFCPRCEDLYYPRSKLHGALDGAFFGSTFPHLLSLTYPSLRPSQTSEKYVPRVFGFKIHPSAYANQQGANNERKPRRVQPNVARPAVEAPAPNTQRPDVSMDSTPSAVVA